MASAEIIAFDSAALAEWRTKLDAARGDAVEGIFQFAAECRAFQLACDRKQGGSVYTEKMAEWYGISHQVASMWATVGAHRAKLSVVTDKFPPSMETIYHLCELPDNVIRDEVTKKTTQRAARALKKKHAPPFRIGWPQLIVERLGVPYGVLRGGGGIAIREKLAKAMGKPVPSFFSDEAEAEEFVQLYLRVIAPKVERPVLVERDEAKVKRAIDAEISSLHRAFHEQVRAEVEKRTAKILSTVDEREEKALRDMKHWQAMRDSIKPFMTLEEYRLVLNCLHPDRAPEDRRDRFTQAFAVMQRLGKVFA